MVWVREYAKKIRGIFYGGPNTQLIEGPIDSKERMQQLFEREMPFLSRRRDVQRILHLVLL
jgi:hypothetical protein